MRNASSKLLLGIAASMAALAAAAAPVAATLEVATVAAAAGAPASPFDGVVEAVRQTVVAARVSGSIVELDAKVGDQVKAGQVLARIDARAAEQSAAASDAQVQAARAALELAGSDFERQRQLFQKGYISQAALDRAESTFKSARAQANAQLAQAVATRTESGYHVVRAPFAGVVSEVPVSLGDMAMPGRALLTLYDPGALRVTAAVPQSVAARLQADPTLRIEVPGLPASSAPVVPGKVQVLPTVDAATHTVQLRIELPARTGPVAPGMFARVWVPLGGERAGPAPLSVPVQAIVRRAEMTGVYVVNPQGKPVLRQVRLGRASEGRVDVLAGLMPGEQVALDPQSAARVR